MRTALVMDAGCAAVVALLVVAIAPGLAVVAVIAISVLTLCVSSFALDAWTGRRPRFRASKRRA
jgi:hypothetical protein